ncbi:MAG TPA: heparinase II/III family protein [Candidatus Hydrogenedentes bacterium]|nr:heparinase II/III family protein [Candidatus Hydrogenedentota bacterium]
MYSWAQLLDQGRNDPAKDTDRSALIDKARELAKEPIIRRAKTLADVGQNRTWLDGRANALEDEIRELFALAMSDFGACSTLMNELPLLAAAYRLTGDASFLNRTVVQLEEMTSWSPLQRPGWTLYAPGHRLPADGKDGNWLATGCGVRCIADTLETLPEGALNADLKERLFALLEKEIAGVVDDWQTKRPWFVRSNDPITNQWVLPTEGLVRACLVLGVEKHRDAYELGVKNLLAALDAHGPKGEFEEGFGYASFTVTSLLNVAHAMAVAGDRRAIDHPFLKNFSMWLVHHFQPGKMVINCFDAGGAYDAAERTRPLLSLLAVCTGSPAARWALANQVGGPSDDLPGLAAKALPPVGPDAAPPLFAYYDRATRVNWRSSWDPDASGVWVRGGHTLDQHDHQDRGHVNFIAHGRPILIEAGTPAYHHPRMMTEYTPGVGHNVLQLGTATAEGSAKAGELIQPPGWQKAHGIAPIRVDKLDETGGTVMVDGTACYDNLTHWLRTVQWDAASMKITDEAVLDEKNPDIVLFRWHLGIEDPVTISGEGKTFTVTFLNTEIHLEADGPLTVTQHPAPDNTLAGHTSDDTPKNNHTCLVLQTTQPVPTFHLTTEITAR